jgi:hypothetical protein
MSDLEAKISTINSLGGHFRQFCCRLLKFGLYHALQKTFNNEVKLPCGGTYFSELQLLKHVLLLRQSCVRPASYALVIKSH